MNTSDRKRDLKNGAVDFPKGILRRVLVALLTNPSTIYLHWSARACDEHLCSR